MIWLAFVAGLLLGSLMTVIVLGLYYMVLESRNDENLQPHRETERQETSGGCSVMVETP